MANKLFRKTSGSSAFVADFPIDDDGVFEPEYGGGYSPDADAGRCVKRQRPPQDRNSNRTLKYK